MLRASVIFPEVTRFNHELKKPEALQTIFCCKCDQSEGVPITSRRSLPPEAVAKIFRGKGWEVGSRRTKDICPECLQKQQLERITRKTKTSEFAPEPPSAFLPSSSPSASQSALSALENSPAAQSVAPVPASNPQPPKETPLLPLEPFFKENNLVQPAPRRILPSLMSAPASARQEIEAPFGYKLDGTPRKSAGGRPRKDGTANTPRPKSSKPVRPVGFGYREKDDSENETTNTLKAASRVPTKSAAPSISPKPTSAPTTSAPSAVAKPVEISQPAPSVKAIDDDTKKIIWIDLDEKYTLDKLCYRESHTDASVAEALCVSVELVAQVRATYYGPSGNEVDRERHRELMALKRAQSELDMKVRQLNEERKNLEFLAAKLNNK